MKALLLQLPVQGNDFFFSHENIPLAAAYLKTIASGQGVDCQLVPHPVMSYGSDQTILRHISDVQPDIVGMSCYEWNVERSLFLSRQIHDTLPQCRIVLGGPEITPDNAFLLRHGDFDMGVVGEGEGICERLLQSFPSIPDAPGLLLPQRDGTWRFSGSNSGTRRLKDLPSPFLSGCLDAHVKDVLWLETVRGCVHRCAYCYYHKQFGRLKSFPVERILSEVNRARDRGVKEIVFLDPCFLRRPRLEGLLDGLATLNQDRGLHFHAECNAEDVDAVKAERLWKAGFTNLEVGLQSIKEATLERIHRRFHGQRFLEGVHRLQQYEMEVMVDLIAGLPGDGLEDICASLDWVIGHEAWDTLMLYPLSLLPATELRQLAERLGLSAMPYPPYLVTGSRELTAADIQEAFRYYETCMEEEVAPLEMPVALNPGLAPSTVLNGLRHAFIWRGPEDIDVLSKTEGQAAYAVTVIMSEELLGQPLAWMGALRDHLRRNPFSLMSIEVPPEVLPDQLRPLWQLAGEHQHLVDRDYTVNHTPYRSFLIFSRAHGLIWKWPDPRESYPVRLPGGQKIPFHPECCVATAGETIPDWFLDHMGKRYPTPPRMRLWRPPEDEDPTVKKSAHG